jgi:hypothetical protein
VRLVGRNGEAFCYIVIGDWKPAAMRVGVKLCFLRHGFQPEKCRVWRLSKTVKYVEFNINQLKKPEEVDLIKIIFSTLRLYESYYETRFACCNRNSRFVTN